MRLTRRDFVRSAAATGAAVAMPGILRAAQDRTYTVALIGTGWWGTNILREALTSGRCTPVGLCDVDDAQRAACKAELGAALPEGTKAYRDYRELLEEGAPDIAIVATPDHWHPLITVACCDAGSHVYVEKPISHTVLEGKAMVEAARRNDRVVQVGTHRRVSPHNIAGMQMLRDGTVGEVGMVRAFVHYGGGPEQPASNEEPPAGLDWDLWCGPGPLRPFNRKIHPKGFRNFLDYANGTLGDWGIHWMDQITWWADEQAPRTIFSTGGRPIAGPAINDGERQTSDAPDHQIAAYEFDGFSVSWEHRRFAGNTAEKTHPGQAVGCYFYGTNGTLHIGWLDGTTFYPVDSKKAAVNVPAELHDPDQQNIRELWADFLDAIATKRRPVSDIAIAHNSTNVALLGMLSYKLGRSIKWDAEDHQIPGDPEADAMLRREYREPWTYPA